MFGKTAGRNPVEFSSQVAIEATVEQPKISLRINQANPDHHLWNNNGTWWIHLTLHLPDFTKRRLRRSLSTSDLATARRQRDHLLAFQNLKLLVVDRSE
jgi:hypothetical protein